MIRLPVRQLPSEVPSYSLTGDVLAFRRCELQYRYYNRSSLPPSRPVQLWTGEFIHGVMEESYLYWRQYQSPFPWPCNVTPIPPSPIPPRVGNDIGELGDQVETRLVAAGKTARSRAARNAAYRRVEQAVNVLGPDLFPLITSVEEKLSGTRTIPAINIPLGQRPRGERYELSGRVDVISSVQLALHAINPIVDLLMNNVPTLSSNVGNFDVIVDYKGARRPPTLVQRGQKNYWQLEEWQVLTYAWLRSEQPNTIPVQAAILIYINELYPSAEEFMHLQREVRNGSTDVIPPNGSPDYYSIFTWQQGNPIPNLTPAFRLRRALRIVPVTRNAMDQAAGQIDMVIGEIEGRALSENATGDIPSNWAATGDENDCSACDFRRFCPGQAQYRTTGQTPPSPTGPG